MQSRWTGPTIVATLLSAGPAPLAAQSLDGHWRTEGHGLHFEVTGSTLKAYELTATSCLPSFTAERVHNATGQDVAFKVVDSPATYIFRSGVSGRGLVHRNGSASDMVVHRLGAPPAQCNEPIPDTPLTNFDVFARTWAEQYGFFDLKNADWKAITARNRPRVSDRTTPQELFRILREMIEPFEDAHTSIRAAAIGETWSGTRKTPTWLERPDRERARAITERKYVRGPLRSWCNEQVQYGRLDSGVAYVRLKSFSNYGPQASRLTAVEYVAYSKQARSDPGDPARWSDEQPSVVKPSSRPSFHGPVALLTGIHSVSAAETFTQALLKREPRVVRIGEHTQGVFSDVLGRRLPNGWRFGLPNERFVTDGRNYDGPGIAPDIPVPVFPKSDLDPERDAALEKALEVLRGQPSAGVLRTLQPATELATGDAAPAQSDFKYSTRSAFCSGVRFRPKSVS